MPFKRNTVLGKHRREQESHIFVGGKEAKSGLVMVFPSVAGGAQCARHYI